MQVLQETSMRKEGIPAHAITLLVSLFLALGIMPGFAVQQAWADEGVTVALTAGKHQGTGATSFEVTDANKSVTLYAQVQDFKLGDSALVQDGRDMYYSSYGTRFTSEDCANFKVTWYEGSVSEVNAIKTGTLEWNDITNKPKWGTDFSCTPESLRTAEDGTYKFYAVATVEKEGYTTTNSQPLEFTVTVSRNSEPQPAEEYGIATDLDPANGGTVSVKNSLTSESLTKAVEKTSVAVDITPAAGKSIRSVKVLNGSGEDVSSAVSLYENTYDYYGSGSEYLFTMPAYAVTISVAFNDGAVQAKKTITFEVRDEDNTRLWEGDDYTVTVKDSEGNVVESNGAYDTDKFDLVVGETYTYTVKGVKDNVYKEITGSYTVSDEYSIVKLTLEAASQSTSAPTLTLVVEPSEAANLVELSDNNGKLVLTDGKASVKAGTKVEVALKTSGTNYEPDSVTVTGAQVQEYGSYYFNMPDSDATVTVKLKSTASEPTQPGTTGDNTGSNTGTNTGSNTGSNAGANTGTNAGSNTASNTNTGSKMPLVVPGANPNANASANANAGNASTAATAVTTVAKKANTMTVKGKTATVKASKLKKKAQKLKVGKVLKVKKAKGKVTYAKKSGNKKITINKKTGKVTVKKGLKKGTYKVKVKVTAAGNDQYKSKSKTVTFKIKVQ